MNYLFIWKIFEHTHHYGPERVVEADSVRIGAAHIGAVGADEPPGEEADHKSCEKKNMSSISMICFLQVSVQVCMYKFGLGVVQKATSVTLYLTCPHLFRQSQPH